MDMSESSSEANLPPEDEVEHVPPEWDADWRERAPAGWAWLVTTGENKSSTVHTFHLLGDYQRPACGVRLSSVLPILGVHEEITCRRCRKLYAPAADLSGSRHPHLRGKVRLWKGHRSSREVHVGGGCRLPIHHSPLRWIGEADEVTCQRCRGRIAAIPEPDEEMTMG